MILASSFQTSKSWFPPPKVSSPSITTFVHSVLNHKNPSLILIRPIIKYHQKYMIKHHQISSNIINHHQISAKPQVFGPRCGQKLVAQTIPKSHGLSWRGGQASGRSWPWTESRRPNRSPAPLSARRSTGAPWRAGSSEDLTIVQIEKDTW